MITAHSGCDGTGMNTMEYLEHAVRTPVDALEIDVRRAGDGRLVLGHDPAGEDTQLPLEVAFRFLADKAVRINCDMKHAGMADDILDCAERCSVASSRIIFTGVIDAQMRRQTDARVFVNAEELMPEFNAPPVGPEAVAALINRCKEAGYRTVNLDHRLCDERLIQAFREAGIGLSAWTVDDPDRIRALLESGVMNITTNLTAEALRAASEAAPPPPASALR